MKVGWTVTCLSEVGSIGSGDSISEAEKNTHYLGVVDGLDYIGTKDVSFSSEISYNNGVRVPPSRSSKFRKAPSGSVLVCSEGGSAGRKVGQIDRPVHFGNKLIAISPSDPATARYVFYYCLSAEFREKFASSMSGIIGGISLKNFRRITIPLAPLAEQRRIVAVLDDAFGEIASAIENTEKSLDRLRGIDLAFQSDLLRKESKEWVHVTIGDVCTLRSGTTVPPSLEKASGELPYIKVADMNFPGNETGVVASRKYLNRNDVRPASVLPAGTTIFPKRGGAIATNKKRISAVPICADLNVMGVIPGPFIDPEFLFLYFRSIDLSGLGSGSSIPQINNYDIAPLPFAYPPLKDDQVAFVKKLQCVAAESTRIISLHERKLVALAELKQSLLASAFSGELTREPLAA